MTELFVDIYLFDKSALYFQQTYLKSEYYDELMTIPGVMDVELLFLPLIQIHYNSSNLLNIFKQNFLNHIRRFDHRVEINHFIFTEYNPLINSESKSFYIY